MREFLALAMITMSSLFVFGSKPVENSDVHICQIDGPVDHNHCTTRQFQHMTFNHEGTYFVFYSDGQDFCLQTSVDNGRTWERAHRPVATAPNGSSSHDVLKVGDSVYIAHAFYPLGRYDVNAPYAKDPAHRGEYRHEGRIKKGRIEGRNIRWLQDVNPGFTPNYCNLVQDSDGHLWVFTREDDMGVAYRSSKSNEIDQWGAKQVCLPVTGRHALDVSALDGARLYVVSLLTNEGRLYGNIYDGEGWGEQPVLIADNLTTVVGDDRRMAIEFDSSRKRLQLVYVDAENKLRCRELRFPYQVEDWVPRLSEPGMELASGVFTCAMSVDTSRQPHAMVITYGRESYVGADQRQRMGELHARYFDGSEWMGDPVQISQPDTVHNWYPNVNQDASLGLCVLYSRSMNTRQLGSPLGVMVSVWPKAD